MPLLDEKDVNWSVKRGVSVPEAAAAFAQRAAQVRAFVSDIEARRNSGTGSQRGKIMDFANRIQPELAALVARTFLDPDAVRWLVEHESHIPDAEHYLGYLESTATRLELIEARLIPSVARSGAEPDSSESNRAMRSTFICYGLPDVSFARILRDALHDKGVRTFFFEADAVPGERIHKVMRQGVNDHDRVVLICSEASLGRHGVKNEIEETLAREARDGGASYLIPITLDEYVFEWRDALGHVLRDRVVADFRDAATNGVNFERGLSSLLRALRV